MNVKVYFKFVPILLLLFVLFSCSTTSNGVFEKRKHLKGWHFKKNKKFDSGSAHVKEDKIFRRKEKSTNPEENSVLTIAELEEIEIVEDGKPKQNEFEIITEALYPDILQPDDENNIRDIGLENTIDNFSVNPGLSTVNETEVSRTKRHPIVIVLGILVFTYLFLLGLGIAMILGFLPALFGGWFILGVPIWLVSGYVVFAFYLYLITKLFEREDGTGSLTLKQAFKKAIWPFVILILAFMALIIGFGWSIY
ncbi:DUF4199 domain-containing protein [Brumimicrobium oceani]|uniref:Uncharacterized protein n=1 Tax=Brumimicrobium oceani TaxID=2100725 RepID=A0A2U2XGD1_9FLAO|nr:DUF4199 domain-containing protein [Brumimicrobium oceani]PWH86856.1 hypothetical protein DIT68_00920 [Brumimicrobium oceani]